MTAIPKYRWAGAAMLRASTYPAGLHLTAGIDLAAEDATDQARRWLTQVWGHPEVREAVTLASPVLGREIGRAGPGSSPRQIRRLALSLASYLARWQRRPTPFGAFAGITGVTAGRSARVLWSQQHDRVLRPDGAWLADVIARLERVPELLERLPLLSNNTVTTRGDRVVVTGVPAGGEQLLMPPEEVSVRATAPVVFALEQAARPILYRELRVALTNRFPTATDEKIDSLLSGLVELQILVTALWPPMTEPDALTHLCRVLADVRAHELPSVAHRAAELTAISYALTTPGVHVPELTERMRAVQDGETAPLMVDTRLGAQVRIPDAVVREAEAAATALVLLSARPYGSARWRDYFFRFRSRYGVGALVPALDLVADNGLGMPADYLGSARTSPVRPATDRDGRLLNLLQQAVMEHREEIELTDTLIADLGDGQDDIVPPARVEVCVEIHAATLNDLDRGRFHLAVTGAPRPASSMAGRFTHLLNDTERAQWASSFTGPGSTPVQLSFAPRRRRDDMLVRCAQLLPHVLALGEHQPTEGAVIDLADVAVTIDTQQFHLVQLSTGRHLKPHVLHALEAGRHTPPLARFLAELATARCAVYTGFDFGVATAMPYLPGVRYRRTILAQPRWLLPASALPPRTAPLRAWEAAFARWRTCWRMPEQVALVDGEQRLPLDLGRPMDRHLLRARLAASARVELRRAPDPKSSGWLGQPHELLLALRQPPHRTAQRHTALPEQAHLPGAGDVLHVQLAGHPKRWDDILTQDLPLLLRALDEPAWWFLRRRDSARPDSEQHLDLFLHLSAEQQGQVVQRIGAWAARLRDEHLLSQLSLTDYQPQTGRYGYGQALVAAHAVFTADSIAALAQIRSARAGTKPQALAAASMVDLASGFTGSPENAMQLLVDILPRHRGSLEPELREEVAFVASAHGPSALLALLPEGTAIAEAWVQRATALGTYRDVLAHQRDPATVLRSLLHAHHLRAVAADRSMQRTTEHLTRTCALLLTKWVQ